MAGEQINIDFAIEKPKTQHELAVWHLLEYVEFSFLDVINRDRFYKFQTRLGEVEKMFNTTLAFRSRASFKNRFGMKGSHLIYKCVNKQLVLSIYNKLKRKDYV